MHLNPKCCLTKKFKRNWKAVRLLEVLKPTNAIKLPSHFANLSNPLNFGRYIANAEMKHKIRFLVILLSLLVSCKSTDLPTPQIDEATDGEISLQLEVISQILEEGERFEIQLEFVNHSNSNVSIIRPLDGSWGAPPLRRQPYYIVEILDEKNQLIPNPFGAQPARDSMFNPLKSDDIYDLRPGDSVQVINQGAFPPYHWVQPTARPGEYRVRVRYAVDAIPEATALELVSNEVNITINGGDEQLWQCYQDQIHLQRNHSFITASLGSFLPFESGYLLIYEKYDGKFVDGEFESIGELYLQQLNEYGESVGNEVFLVEKSNSIGNVEAINVPDGVLIVLTPNDVGSRSVEVIFVSLDEGVFQPGKLQVISPPPGNPYFIGLASYENVVGLAYKGNKQQGETLVFQLLDRQGTALRQPQYIADTTMSELILQATTDGFLLGWNEGKGKIGLLHLDKAGQPIQPAQQIILGDGIVMKTFGVAGNQTYLVAHDNTLSGDNQDDTMGLYLFHLKKNGELLKPPIPLTPLTRDYPAFGVAVSIDNILGRIYEEDDHNSGSNAKLWFSIFLGDIEQSQTLLAETVGGIYELRSAANRFLVAWEDHRDDKSRGCKILERCVNEVYISIFDTNGQQQVLPTRITQVAQPPPFLFGDYERFCQIVQ